MKSARAFSLVEFLPLGSLVIATFIVNIIPVIGHYIYYWPRTDSKTRLRPRVFRPDDDHAENTMLGWNNVPAILVAMAIRSRWP